MALGWLTENGWPSCAHEDCDNSVVPGTTVSIPVQIGIPNTILKAFLADLNAYVEPYNGQGDWGGWTPTNSVATSNHLGGTAVDFNWEDHPMGPEAEDPAAGWKGSDLIDGDEVPAVRKLLDFYEGLVFWGNDWDTPKDSMHFQMGYDTYNNIPKCMDFIGRKIRKDMFSVYQRGGTSQNGTVWPAGVTVGKTPPATGAPIPVPPPAPAGSPDPVDVLVRATGLARDRCAAILPTLSDGLVLAQCTNPNRIAMFIAETQEESDNYATTTEYGKGAGKPYFPFYGRTWIQITWQSNYAKFGAWCAARGLVTDPNQFVNNPDSLADLKWAGIGAAWFWISPHDGHNPINDDADAGDVVAVTHTINGGENGLDVRTANWNRARAVGNDLLALITPATPVGGPLDALTPEEQHQLLDDVAYIKNQIGPTDPNWGADSSLGKDTAGKELTMRDGMAEFKRFVEAILSNPRMAILTLQAATAPPAPPAAPAAVKPPATPPTTPPAASS